MIWNIVGMDIDGVILDLHAEWIVNRYNKFWGDHLTHESFTAWDVTQFVKPECGEKVYDILSHTDLYDDVPLIKNHSLHYINLLRAEHGKRFVFATSVIGEHGGQKLKALRRFGYLPQGRYTEDYIEASDKSLLNFDVMVDDYHGTIQKFLDRGKAGILYSQPWNRSFTTSDPNFYRVSTFEEIYELVKSR